MKKLTRVVLMLAVAAAAAASLPAGARVAPADDLQVLARGADGLVAGKAGCTRITNRFCTQSTQSNCFACH